MGYGAEGGFSRGRGFLVMDYDDDAIEFLVTKDDIQFPVVNICTHTHAHIWAYKFFKNPSTTALSSPRLTSAFCLVFLT